MKPPYTLLFSGCLATSDRFTTLQEARSALSEALKEELAIARRSWKSAAIIRGSKDSGSIYATRDSRSPLWTSIAIVPV